jgi:hypothetical protein
MVKNYDMLSHWYRISWVQNDKYENEIMTDYNLTILIYFMINSTIRTM